MNKYLLLSLACIILLTACSQNKISGPYAVVSPTSDSQSHQNDNMVSSDTSSERTSNTQSSAQNEDEPSADISQPQNTGTPAVPTMPSEQKTYTPQISYSDIKFDHAGIYDLVDNTAYSIDLNNDGANEQLSLVNTTHDEEMIWNGEKMTITAVGDVTLKISSKEYNDMIIQYGLYAYLIIRDNGNIGLLVCGELPNDNYTFYIYRFENGEPVLTGEGRLELTDLTMNTFKQSGTIYLFGNHRASIHCALNDDFTYEYLDNGYYELSPQPLKTKIDISVYMLVSEEYLQTIIPAGKTLIPTRINPKGCMFFKLENGMEGKLDFTTDDFICYIDGKQETDVFDGIYYAGG